jgi:hypothetical protein
MFHTENLRPSCVVTRRFCACVVLLWFGVLAAPAFGQSHVHQLFYNGSDWGPDLDLTATYGGPSAGIAFGIAALYTQSDPVLHVYYGGTDSHLHQFYSSDGTSWAPGDLTVASSGVDVTSFTGIGAFQVSGNQYVYFCGVDGFIHEYSLVNDLDWHDTQIAVGPCPNVTNAIVAFDTSDGQRHVLYDYASGRPITYYLHELSCTPNPTTDMCPPSSWTSEPFAEKMGVASWISGFPFGPNQYVFFGGLNQHVYMESNVNGSWAQTDLTAAAGGPLACDSGTASFAVPGTTQMEVYYDAATSSTTCGLHQMTFANNAWTDTDVTAQAGGSAPSAGSQIIALSAPGSSNVFLNEDLDVFQLDYNGTAWGSNQLSGPQAYNEDGMAGFTIGSDLYVYYLSQP